jgi:ABC-type Zn2+ transport system substrate-binding protein/surface adhesin
MAVICDYANSRAFRNFLEGDETGDVNELPLVEPIYTTCLELGDEEEEEDDEEDEDEQEEDEHEDKDQEEESEDSD